MGRRSPHIIGMAIEKRTIAPIMPSTSNAMTKPTIIAAVMKTLIFGKGRGLPGLPIPNAIISTVSAAMTPITMRGKLAGCTF